MEINKIGTLETLIAKLAGCCVDATTNQIYEFHFGVAPRAQRFEEALKNNSTSRFIANQRAVIKSADAVLSWFKRGTGADSELWFWADLKFKIPNIHPYGPLPPILNLKNRKNAVQCTIVHLNLKKNFHEDTLNWIALSSDLHSSLH